MQNDDGTIDQRFTKTFRNFRDSPSVFDKFGVHQAIISLIVFSKTLGDVIRGNFGVVGVLYNTNLLSDLSQA